MKAVLLISHGSRLPQTETEIQGFVKKLRLQSNISIFEYAFLEITKPTIPEGIDICVEKGATEIIILLNFLNAGKHVDEDIPQIVDTARNEYPDIKFHITKPIGQYDQITKIYLDLIDKADS